MLNFSISWWELALLIIAIALVIGVVYLVRFLKSFITTLTNLNGLITDNRRAVENILDNVDVITRDTSRITDKADGIADEVSGTVTAVKADVVNPLIQSAATVVKMISTSTQRKSHDSNES